MSQTFGITLPLQIENNGYFGTNRDLLRQIRSNLKNLLLTRKGERLHQPTFGCDISEYVFEPNTNTTIENAYASIVDAVETWMPFIEIVNFNLENTIEDTDAYRIKMFISFRLRTNQNITDSIVLTF